MSVLWVGDLPNPVSLPDKFQEFHPHQITAITEILKRYAEGYPIVMLDAPTGAGKTLIGEVVRQQLNPLHGLYTCTTLTLQAQFLREFTYAALIKGRDNYPTLDYPDAFDLQGHRRISCMDDDREAVRTVDLPACRRCESGASCDLALDRNDWRSMPSHVMHCSYCHPWQLCPYQQAKNTALAASLVIANTSYFVTEANRVGSFAAPHFGVGVADEADVIEGILMSYVELIISPRFIDRLGMLTPEKVTKVESWVTWLTEARLRVEDMLVTLADKLAVARRRKGDDPAEYRATLREVDTWTKRLLALGDVQKALESGAEDWVLDGYQKGGVNFRPVHVREYGQPLLWQHAPVRWLLMSATLSSDEVLAEDLGITEWATVRVDSRFPVWRRPINVVPQVSMTQKTKDEAWPLLAKGVAEVLRRHPTERVLVHSVSYDLTRFLVDALTAEFKGRLVSYVQASERQRALERYRVGEASVMIAPSLDRGVDLYDDLARVIIICKVPWASLGDKQVSARFYGTGVSGRNWFATKAIRTIVQMTGRGMRHADDHCVSYILDSQFSSNLWRNYHHFFPGWWKEALKWHSGPLRPSR